MAGEVTQDPPVEAVEGAERPEQLEPGEIAHDGAALEEAADTSWIAQVKRERDARVEVETLKLGMPTWGTDDNPDLVIEFKVIPRPELEDFQRKSQRQIRKRKGASDVDIQFIAKACVGVYIRNPESGELVHMVDENDRAIRLDKRLARLLDLPEDGAGANSQTLILYLSKDNGIALGNLAIKVARWMTNTSAEVEGEVLGE